MILQLKDLASQKLISVPEEGLTFGREGGDAQVQVADMGVSKRHAEIFCEGGAWFLKDLGSSNGTMLANERIADATEILPGDVFQLSKRKFEVLEVVEDGAEEEEAPPEDDGPMMTEPERKPAARPNGKPARRLLPRSPRARRWRRLARRVSRRGALRVATRVATRVAAKRWATPAWARCWPACRRRSGTTSSTCR
jgi:pSer/pThr/pTyr-binding forkhead associated (FHA) protein